MAGALEGLLTHRGKAGSARGVPNIAAGEARGLADSVAAVLLFCRVVHLYQRIQVHIPRDRAACSGVLPCQQLWADSW